MTTTKVNTLDVIGQATFDLAPHCVIVPTFSEDLTNKLYVDSRIASGGSNFFYFNYSVVSNVSPLKQLGNSIVITTPQTVSTFQLNINSIAKFISDVGVPNITTIPSGIWELNQWGNAVGGIAGTLVYYFELSTYRPSTGVYTPRGTSGDSQVIDLTTPSLYFAALSLASFAVDLEDRIVIEVFSRGTLTGGVNTLNSYYQENKYSYLSCPIIEGTDLLNKNNSWTGTNSFSNTTTVPTLASQSNTTGAVNSAYVTSYYVPNSGNTTLAGTKTFTSEIVAGGIGPSATGVGFNFCLNQTTGTIGIGDAASRSAAITIGSGATSSHNLNISNGATHTGTVNIISSTTSGGSINLASGTGATQTTTVNIASGTTTGAVTIGNSANTTTINSGLTLSKPINVGYSAVAPAATYLGGTIGGGFTATALGPSIYAFLQSFQLPIGTYLFNLGGQMQYSSGTFTQNYSTIYTGLTQYAKTTNVTPYYFGTNTIVSTTPFFIGFNGNIVLAVTTANLWYTVGCTWVGSAGGSVSSIIGVFTATRLY